jgi:hypothetical protein
MRSHAVFGFPDPSTTETPNSFGIDGYNFDLPSTMDIRSHRLTKRPARTARS